MKTRIGGLDTAPMLNSGEEGDGDVKERDNEGYSCSSINGNMGIDWRRRRKGHVRGGATTGFRWLDAAKLSTESNCRGRGLRMGEGNRRSLYYPL